MYEMISVAYLNQQNKRSANWEIKQLRFSSLGSRKKNKKYKQSLRCSWDTIIYINISIMGVSEGEGEKGAENMWIIMS